MKCTVVLALALLLSTVAANVVLAQTSDMNKNRSVDMKSMDMKGRETINGTTAATTHTGHGVVKSVNTVDGIVTFAHEPIKTLGWPAMTMGFKVRNKQLIDKMKPGDKVEFTLVPEGKDYVVTSIR